jgi:hypothetical protein
VNPNGPSTKMKIQILLGMGKIKTLGSMVQEQPSREN